jgi:hypothetical protein
MEKCDVRRACFREPENEVVVRVYVLSRTVSDGYMELWGLAGVGGHAVDSDASESKVEATAPRRDTCMGLTRSPIWFLFPPVE